ncbi:hypothetical protein [Pseudomonas fluorescens]|uniref:hypothetical protein n=1 Tax=Pseudomonas fluorescens TaxID=294 RepID=UPI001D0D0FE4|nr:hypothetical protein [Pseudomonas fluorescens]
MHKQTNFAIVPQIDRGGIQYDLMIATDALACSSAYGLCDTDPEHVNTPEAA